MPKKQKPKSESDNTLVAVISLVIIASVTAWMSAWVCGYVLDAFQSSNTMALLITDAGIKSDDAKLEGQLSTATVALKTIRDFAWALGIGCGGVAIAIAVRLFRKQS
jgi:hypothetical protein